MPSSHLPDPRCPLPNPRLSRRHSKSLLVLLPSLLLPHSGHLQFSTTPGFSTHDERSVGLHGTLAQSCIRQVGWGMLFHSWKGVPSSLRRCSSSGSPNNGDNTLQVRPKGRVKGNGRPLRRNYQDGGVRLVHALGKLGSVRRVGDSSANK